MDIPGRFTILGESGSGKTCYLLGMYNKMRNHVAGYTVIAEDTSKGDMLFKLQYNYEDVLSFVWIDYPGAYLEPSKRDLNSADYQAVEKYINESDVLFICIDGANFVEGDINDKIDAVETKCTANISPYLGTLIGKLRNEGKTLPPIAMIVTKYDMCESYIDTNELRNVIEEVFTPLFGKDDTYVAIIPVSLGKLNKDNRGVLQPRDIHLPILFGIKFALLGRIAFENSQIQKIKTDITKKVKNTIILQMHAPKNLLKNQDFFFLEVAVKLIA